MTLSFGFIVGGDDSYYKNLMRACESLERVSQTHEIVILDMDDRLEIDDPKVKIVSGSAEKVENKDDRNWFQPHIWKERFNLYKHVETDYCIYLDSCSGSSRIFHCYTTAWWRIHQCFRADDSVAVGCSDCKSNLLVHTRWGIEYVQHMRLIFHSAIGILSILIVTFDEVLFFF